MKRETPSRWKSMRKVELHRHLELSLRLETLLEVAPSLGIRIPGWKQGEKLTEETLRELHKELLILKPMQSLSEVLSKFLMMQKAWASEELIERLTYEICVDAQQEEGIAVLELRYSPTFIQGASSLSFEKIHEAICRGIDRARSPSFVAGPIGILQRTLPPKEAEQVVHFFIDHRDKFIGVDLADREVGFEGTRFIHLFEQIQKAGLPITIHAGEEPHPESARFIRDAINHLGATRIGHGVQIIHDPETMEFVKEKDVALELCLTSNCLTQAVPSMQEHPIRKLLEAGLKVTINTDDPTIFHTNLNHEYDLLEEHFDFNRALFHQCNQFAAEASFLPHFDVLHALSLQGGE